MKMVLSPIASNVELCKVAQLHPLFPIPQWCELLHDLFSKVECVYSACFYQSVLLTAPYITHLYHRMKYTDCCILLLV